MSKPPARRNRYTQEEAEHVVLVLLLFVVAAFIAGLIVGAALF